MRVGTKERFRTRSSCALSTNCIKKIDEEGWHGSQPPSPRKKAECSDKEPKSAKRGAKTGKRRRKKEIKGGAGPSMSPHQEGARNTGPRYQPNARSNHREQKGKGPKIEINRVPKQGGKTGERSLACNDAGKYPTKVGNSR